MEDNCFHTENDNGTVQEDTGFKARMGYEIFRMESGMV